MEMKMEMYEAVFWELRIAAGEMILRGRAWIRETEPVRYRASVEVQATLSFPERDATIKILRVVRGELTGHDTIEVARVAEEEAHRLLRERQLVTKNQLMAVNDWHLEWCDDQNGYLASRSLNVRLAIGLDGRFDNIHGCLIQSGGRYVPFCSLRERKWAERMVRKALLRLAMRVPKKPDAADGELDDAA
jgi:hypothetical protein